MAPKLTMWERGGTMSSLVLTLFTWTGNLFSWLAYAGLHRKIGAKTYHVEKRRHNVVVGFDSFYLDRESGRLTHLCGTWGNGAKTYHVEKRPHNVVVGLAPIPGQGIWSADSPMQDLRKWRQNLPCEKEAAQCRRWFWLFYLDRESVQLTRLCGTWGNGAKTYHVEKRPHNVVVGLVLTWTGNLVSWLAYAGLEKMTALFPKLHAQGGSEKVENNFTGDLNSTFFCKAFLNSHN